MIRFFHIINPYLCPPATEAFLVQERTLESLVAAEKFAEGVVDVNFIVRTDPRDGDLRAKLNLPINSTLKALKRFSFDVGDFEVPKSLPLLADMFDVDVAAEEGCYVVYTNMDICVTPFFYTECARILRDGCECMVINRRTVEKQYLNLPLTQGFTALSQNHPGHDCFVFPAAFLRTARLPDSILGIGYVFRPMLLNCILHFAEHFREFDNYYMTMHFGDDMDWKDPRYADYLEYNKTQLINTWRGFSSEIEVAARHPYVAALLKKHFPFSFLK